jgi:7-cyano-7-deazaguanine synthase in queuosine biosynthesis
VGARAIYLGVNAIDYSGYPDCRQEFLTAFAHTAALATAAGAEQGARFEIRAPLVALSKRDIVLRARALGVDLGLTHTCYDPHETQGVVQACGRCDACSLRLKGFADGRLAFAARPMHFVVDRIVAEKRHRGVQIVPIEAGGEGVGQRFKLLIAFRHAAP